MGRDSGLVLSGFKSLGDAGWEGFFTNIFPDRDVSPEAPKGERFPLAAVKEYADWANESPENMPELQFWHMPNLMIGKAHTIEVIGPCVYAAGDWGNDAIGQAAKAYYSSPQADEIDWGMSHGYRYLRADFQNGEYTRFRTHEISPLPLKWASNPITGFSEADMTDSDGKKGLKEELTEALQSVFGIDPKAAAKAVADGIALQKKSLGEDEAAGQKGPESPDDEGDDDTEVTEDTLALALAESLVRVEEATSKQAALETSLKELNDRVKQLEDALKGEQANVKALQEEAQARKALLPKAVAAALEARKGQGPGVETVPPADVAADAAKQTETLANKKDSKEDPLGWMAEKAGIPLEGG